MTNSIESIPQLWERVKELNLQHFPNHRLAPILGGGQTANPEAMFVFINPTARNISSNPDWRGPRFPFIGTKPVWRVFHRSGLLNDSLMKRIEEGSCWSVPFSQELEDFLKNRGLYLTNLVKWTGGDGSLPDRRKIQIFRPLLIREIELVNPRHIVTFGLLPFEKLTGRKIRLSEYYEDVVKRGAITLQPVQIGPAVFPVVPCYFPVGRGNPQRAIEILRLFKESRLA